MTKWDAIAQHATPLLTALQQCATRSTAPFHTPGHKRGQSVDSALQALLGDRVFAADLPELPELDNLFAPSGVLQQAQELAAQAFGAEQTWFLANGSTSGVIAAILATCDPGDKIILPRNVHQSAISGLVLTGAIPIWVQPEYDPSLDLAHSVTPDAIALALNQNPDAKAVMIVSPTYLGVCGDVAAIAQLCHQHYVPLLVDEAHGAHFGFHPALPISALQAGTDLAVQSTHKVLSALTQAAMLHVQGTLINRDRLTKALAFIQSTSPNYLLLASLDATRRQMATQGKELMEQTLQLASKARSQLTQLPGLSLLTPKSVGTPGFFALDPTRLTVRVTGLGINGFKADELLNQQYGVVAELPTLRHLTFIISLGNTQADIHQLVSSFAKLAAQRGGSRLQRERSTEGEWGVKLDPQLSEFKTQNSKLKTQNSKLIPPSRHQLSPRTAFFAAQETVVASEAMNRISAELVCPYPPGIAVLVPGEVITAGAIAHLHQTLMAGGILSGCSDPSLKTLKVVKQPHSTIELE